MKKQMRRWLAVGIAAVMVLQAVHVENYGGIKEVFASQAQNTEKQTEGKRITEDLGEIDAVQKNTVEENTAQENTTEVSTEVMEAVEEALQEQSYTDYIKELYAENGLIENDLSISQPSRLTCDLTVKGNLSIYQYLDLNGYTLTVTGNASQTYEFSLNGSLVVNGDYNWMAGNINFNKGSLFVHQNMNITMQSEKIWNMDQEEGYLFVGGNLVLDYNSGLTTNITNGIIELQGDFLQNIYFDSYSLNTSKYDFVATGNNTLLLSGNRQQTIYISKETSGFQSVEVSTLNRETETEGVYDFGEQIVSFSQYYNYESYESHSCPTNYGYTEIETDTLAGNTYIYGNGYLKSGTLDLDAYSLYVQGDFVQNGNVCMGTGKLCVLGDYRIQSAESTEEKIIYSATPAVVDSTENCNVYVMGDFITESVMDHTGFLTNGTWHFYGNITQIGTEIQNFATGENWVGVLERNSGIGNDRIIRMDNPMGNPVNKLSLYSPNGTLYLENGIYLNQSFGYNAMTLDGTVYIDNRNIDILSSIGGCGCSVTICEALDCGSQHLTVSADVTLLDDFKIDGGYMICNNLVVEAGTLTIHNGYVYTENITFTDAGTGSLYMQDENAKLNCNDFYMGSNAASGVLSDGEIHIKGNLTQRDFGTPDNLVASDQMDLILEGSGNVQIVHFDSMESELENVYIRNTKGGCVVFDTEVNIHNLYDESHTLRENGLVGYRLEADKVYTDSVQLCGGILDLNGHTLTVEKDFLVSAGALYLNGGTLIVKGDFRCQDMYTEDGQEVYGPTTANIVMDNETDCMWLEKDWYVQIKGSDLSSMEKGDIRIAGNINIVNDASIYSSIGEKMIGGANLLFRGSSLQSIEWEGKAVNLYVHDLHTDNSTTVSSEAVIYTNGTVSKIQEGTIKCKSIHVNHIEDIACEELEGSVYVEGGGALQHDLTIKGSLTNLSTVQLAGHTLGADSIYMQAPIRMEHAEDTIRTIDMCVNVKSNDSTYMTDGTIYINGNFIDSTTSDYAFLPSENHVMVFEQAENSGSGKAKLTFNNTASKLNIVIIKGKLNAYTLNRKKENIANQLILDYEDVEKPEAPKDIACISTTCMTISLTWSEVHDNMEVEKYIIYRDGVYVGETHTTVYTDVNLNYATAYRYSVAAQDAKGNQSDKSEILHVVTNGDGAAPHMEKQPVITATDTEITIDCAGTYADDENYVDYYIIARDGEELDRIPEKAYFSYVDPVSGPKKLLIHDGAPTCVDADVEKRASYTYGIIAVDMAGNQSEEYQIEVAADPLPAEPEAFALDTEGGYNYISFEKSGLRECKKYNIYRKRIEESSFKLLVTIENDEKEMVNYEDTEVTAGNTYYYYVQTYNQYGVKGKKTQELSIVTRKDQILPEITSTWYSVDGDIVNDTLGFAAEASDNGQIKDIYAYYIKEGETEQVSVKRIQWRIEGKTAIGYFELDTSGLEGIYTLHIAAEDSSGNCIEEEKTIKVNVEGLPPVTIKETVPTADSVSIEWEPLSDAAFYRVEKFYNGKYTVYGDTEDIAVVISNLRNNTEYRFRITAYDTDNARGLSAPVVVETVDDLEAPVVSRVIENNAVFGMSDVLRIGYKDNVEVAKVTAVYRKTGSGGWNPIGEAAGSGSKGEVSIPWDKTGLVSGSYEVKYQAEDSSGNVSEEVIMQCELELDAPVIRNFTLVPKDWQILVKWDAFEEKDFAGYRLVRVGEGGDEILLATGSDTVSFKEMISPKEEYTYRLYAYDIRGNEAWAEVTGTSIDNDVFAPEVCDVADMFAAADMAMQLSAKGCTDNDGIQVYEWDMGNGEVIIGENCSYVYQEPGTYQATLTVRDISGNEAKKSFQIMVGLNTGGMNVTVKSGSQTIQGANVVVCLNGKPYHNGLSPQTNFAGDLYFPISSGTYKVAAYKTGYTPQEITVDVEEGKTTEVTLNLQEENFIKAEFTTKEMTYEEMKKAGIDTEANKAVYQYSLDLEFQKYNIPSVEFNSSGNTKEWNWRIPAYTGKVKYPTLEEMLKADLKDETEGDIYVNAKNVSDDPSHPVWTLTTVEPVTISWLANVYKVSMTVCNNASDSFPLVNANAKLELPDGLFRADMKESKNNNAEWNIGTIEGGKSKKHSWYVTGYEAGTYDIKVDFEATLKPFNSMIKQKIVSKDALTVTVGEGLHLYIYPEENAYIGEYYYIQYKLKNESKEDYHYVTTDFGAFQSETAKGSIIVIQGEGENKVSYEMSPLDAGIMYFVEDSDAAKEYIKQRGKDRVTVKTLKSGEAIYGTYKMQFNASGNKYEEYYRLINTGVNVIEGQAANMEVTVEPVKSHLMKQIVHIKSAVGEKMKTESQGDEIERNKRKAENDRINGANEERWKSRTNKKLDEDYENKQKEAQTKDTTQTVKDPVNLMTGAFTTNHVLAAVAGAQKLSFDLSYNSLLTEEAGDLGRGWYHNYEKKLERTGSLLTLYMNPCERMYFAESDETENIVCGTVEGNTVTLMDDSAVERIYYQTGTDSKKYCVKKNMDGYTLSAENEQYFFNPAGELTGYMNEEGQKVIVQKEDSVLTITDEVTGKHITASYDGEGRIVKVTDAAGNVAELCYEGENLVRLISKSGTELVYEYDEAGHIIRGKEKDGTVFVENSYDEEGRVLTQTANEKQEELTRFSYSENSENGTTEVTMTNADGTTEKAVSDRYGQGIRYENAIGGVTTYEYNISHDITAYHAPDGTGESYTYDANGNIASVTEAAGKQYQYTYNNKNQLVQVTGNDGTDIQYTYNDKGQITEVTGGNGIKVSYTYNEDGQVLTEQSALGTMTYHYEKGMLKALEDYSGNTHSFAYDANGNVTQYVDGNGIVTDYKLDLSGRVLSETVNMEDGRKASVSYTYDAYGNVLTKTDALGNTTGYTYDEEDRISAETRPDGSKIRYEYDVNGNITKITMPDGETKAEAVYDAAGNTLSLVDTLGNIKNASYSAGSQLLSMTQGNGGTLSFTYYENGLLESQTDANGNTLTISYDEAGRVIQTADAEGNTTGYEYDRDGNLCKVEDALGNSTEIGYNEYRKVASQKDANGNITTYDYDKALNCIRVTDAEQGVTEFSYDANGQIKSMTKKGETKEQDITLSMTYDNLGNVTSLTDGEGNVRKMEYDLNSNLTAVYDAKGVKTAAYTYDEMGNQKTAADAFGNVTENTYDSFGNLVKQMNEATGAVNTYSYVGGKYLAGSTDALENAASMTYDSMGNVETLTNPNGGVTTYQYDLNNNLTDEIIGEDYHVRYTYNAWNLAATKTNSRGQETSYSYDALGRLVHQEDEAGIIDYTYDANGNVLTTTETIGTTVNTITRTYDGLNRVTSYEYAKGNKTGYEYDKTGNLVKLTYPNGKAVTYTYDKNCNIKTVTDWKNRTTAYSYDENGRLVKTERPNKTVETRGYDKAGQLILILDKCGDTEVNRQEYCYDAAGNITEVKQLYNGELDFTDVTTAKMTYDKNNRLLTYNDEKVEYDKDGNMVYGPLQGRMTQFVFDCRNRLVKAGDTSYEYDAENNRIAVITGAKRTEYVVNSQPELSQVLQSTVTDGEREETTYYFYGKGLISQENVTGGYLTYHFNNVGSTMAVTDENGTVRYSYHYSPYGELLEGEYSENVPFLYNGQYGVATDGNGLYYMRARYYNVDVKRFVNQDVVTGTLERISSLNRYAYVEGNPVSYLDPFGLEKHDTAILHTVSTVLGIVGTVVSIIFPFSGVGNAISILANGIDIIAYISDLIHHIKTKNTVEAVRDASWIIIDIIGMITAGATNTYKNAAIEAATYKGIMGGYEYQTSMLYNQWNFYASIQTGASLAVQVLEYYLK